MTRMLKTPRFISSIVAICCILALAPFTCAVADEGEMRSFHLGILHPNGVDFVGYSVEEKFKNDIYYFYTYGFPSIAALGLAYYANHEDDGLTGTFGIGIGSVMYGAIAYQWKIKATHFVKLGAGVTTSIVYTGAFPVLSYEHRFH